MKQLNQNTLLSKAIIQNRRRDKEFPRQTQVKGIHHHYTRLTRNVQWILLSGKERPKARVRKVGSTKAVKLSVSIKISQGFHKIKGCRAGHCIPKVWERGK